MKFKSIFLGCLTVLALAGVNLVSAQEVSIQPANYSNGFWGNEKQAMSIATQLGLKADDLTISPNGLYAAAYGGDKAIVFDKNANIIQEVKYQDQLSDPSSLAIARNNGDLIYRVGVTRFEWTSADGKMIASVSNASGSQEGESISQFSMADDAFMQLMYAPLIKMDGNTNSVSQLIGENNKRFLASEDGYTIHSLNVLENGLKFIVVYEGEKDDLIKVYDKYGVELVSQSVEKNFEIVNAELSHDGEYFTVYSKTRAIVYGVPSGKRYGSTSVQTQMVSVELDPSTMTLYCLAGDYEGNQLENVEIKAVSFSKKKVKSADYSKGLVKLPLNQIKASLKTIDGKIMTEGFESNIQLSASF